MHPYFVEGYVRVKIDIELEADSLEDAKNKAIQQVKDMMIFDSTASLIEDFFGLDAEEFSDHDYSQKEESDEVEDEDETINNEKQ